MTKNETKRYGCETCPNRCEPRDNYPMGTCIAAIGWVHGLDKMASCPIIDEKELYSLQELS